MISIMTLLVDNVSFNLISVRLVFVFLSKDFFLKTNCFPSLFTYFSDHCISVHKNTHTGKCT